MDTQEIKEQLTGDQAIGKTFKVYGYVDSDGNKRDVTYKVIGREGKRTLYRESQLAMNMGQYDKQPIEDATDDLWDDATKAVQKTINNSLNGGNQAAFERQSKAKRDPRAVYVEHLQEISRENEKIVKTKKSRIKTKIQDQIKKSLPMGSYTFNIKLLQGKFDRIEILK